MAGHALELLHALLHSLSAVVGFLRFSAGWQYIVELDALPETGAGAARRKAQSRWGAAFTRQAGALGSEAVAYT